MSAFSTRWLIVLCAAAVATLAAVYAIWLRPEGGELFRVEAPEPPLAEVERKGGGEHGGKRHADRRSANRSSPAGGGIAISGGSGLAAAGAPPAGSRTVSSAPLSPAPGTGPGDGDGGGGSSPASDQYRDSVSELLTQIASGR